MDVEMRYGFAAVVAVVDDEAESGLVQTFLVGNVLRDVNHVAEQRLVGRGGGGNARDFLFRDDEDVDGRLGLDVMEGQAKVVLEGDPGWNLAVDDLREEGAHNG